MRDNASSSYDAEYTGLNSSILNISTQSFLLTGLNFTLQPFN